MRTSFIRLRANARIAVLYEDLLEVCDGNMLAAMLLSTLVYWTDTKLAQKDENLWIWKTHEGFQEDLMFDKPGMKPPHRTTISSALDLLRNKKFVEWRKNPKMPLDRTRQYLVHQEELQAAIDKLPILEGRKSNKGMSEKRLSTEAATEASPEDLPNVGKTTMQSRNSDNAVSEKRLSNVEKPTSNTSDYSPVITVPVITREGTYSAGESEDVAASDASASTPTQSPESDNHSHIATPTTGDTNGHTNNADTDRRNAGVHSGSDSGVAGGHSQWDSAGDRGATRTQQHSATRTDTAHSAGYATNSAGTTRAVTPGNGVGGMHDRATHPVRTGGSDGASVPSQLSGSEMASASQEKQVASQSAAASDGYEKAEQATLAAPAPVSARQAPTFSNVPLFASTRPARPTLTEGGKQVRDWYQLIRATKVRLTNENINACNGLDEEDGISFETLKKAIEHWEKDPFVKNRGIPIDLIQLEKPSGSFTYAKAMLVIRGRKKPADSAPTPATPAEIEENPYSFAAQLARNPLPTLRGATV